MHSLRTLLPRVQDMIGPRKKQFSYVRTDAFSDLSLNPSLPIQFIQENFDEPWDWYAISMNPAIDCSIIKQFPLWFWKFSALSENENLEPDFYMENLSEDWDFAKLSDNRSVPMEFIRHHIEKDWDFRRLSHHPCLDYYLVRDEIDRDWDWPVLVETIPSMGRLALRVPDRIDEFINDDDDFLYDIDEIGTDAYSAEIEIVEEFLTDPNTNNDRICWATLSENQFLTGQFINEHIDLPWDYGALSCNPGIETWFVNEHLDKPWAWGIGGLSENPNVTEEFVEEHINEGWEWGRHGLSHNLKISADFVFRFPDKNWSLSYAPLWLNIFDNRTSKRLVDVHEDVKTLPGIGVLYFEAREMFNAEKIKQ